MFSSIRWNYCHKLRTTLSVVVLVVVLVVVEEVVSHRKCKLRLANTRTCAYVGMYTLEWHIIFYVFTRI